MDSHNSVIGDKLEEIRNLLDIEQHTQIDPNAIKFAWYVGATGNNDDGVYTDFSDQYIEEGRWENRWDTRFTEEVKAIKPGDRIALKSCYTRKKELPFDNNGKTVGVMAIKAIGIVTDNPGDGKNISVEWVRVDPIREWFGPGTLRTTLHLVKATDGYIKQQLLKFTFENAAQDYSLCEEQYSDETSESDAPEEVPDYDSVDRLKGGTNIILYGVPGAGKSWTIKHEYCDDESLMERLVFHPDYTYSDFVGQILPKISDDGGVSYEFSAGPFTKLVRKAYTNPDKMFYLVIEEVNRGNAPAIFGDVFQLLDRNKDGGSEYAITNADIAKIVYLNDAHKLTIPSNMSILCTMNTSDQNVFTLDTAFQRRWNMRLIRNKFHDETDEKRFAGTKILDTDVTWEKFFTEINDFILGKNIRMTSSEDKRLGTHFVSEDDLSIGDGSEKQISRFPEKVLKYLWDDAFKFTKEDVFDLEKVKSLEDVIDMFVSSTGNDRFLVFKENIFNTLVPKKEE